MNERVNSLGLGDDPIKLNRILDEILLDFNELSPTQAAVNALIALEATPNFKRAVGWKNDLPDSPQRQYYEEAKSYMFTLNKLSRQLDKNQLTDPEDDPDESNDKESRPSLIGKLHAYKDVLIVLDNILG